jgi:hypothetical protein
VNTFPSNLESFCCPLIAPSNEKLALSTVVRFIAFASNERSGLLSLSKDGTTFLVELTTIRCEQKWAEGYSDRVFRHFAGVLLVPP